MFRKFKKLLNKFKRYTRWMWVIILYIVKEYIWPALKYIFKIPFLIIKFIWKVINAIAQGIMDFSHDIFTYPFRSVKNFIKAIFYLLAFSSLVLSVFVNFDYIKKQYGYLDKFFCAIGSQDEIKNKVVRIVGAYSEGSGFFVQTNRVLTNFHVIDQEVSPKIILASGEFITPTKIIGDRKSDLAILVTDNHYPDLVMPLSYREDINENETLLATGYALGTDLSGKATLLKGNFIDLRKSRNSLESYIQTSINLAGGMSGGPLTDICGQVVGINTMSLAGMSLFIPSSYASTMMPLMNSEEIVHIAVDPDQSPEDAVEAFYTYLKTRRMEDGYNLLSQEYLQKTSFEEWTSRFPDVLDVIVVKVEREEGTDDTVFVKFSTKNWVDGEVEYHDYEGTWQTILEDGVYKMLKSNIKEVVEADQMWWYE